MGARVRYNVALIQEDMAVKGWLPVHLATGSGLSQMTIGRFLSGETQTAPSAKKIADALGQPVRRYIVAPGDRQLAGQSTEPAKHVQDESLVEGSAK